jgi:carboxymethylenebutenolidase
LIEKEIEIKMADGTCDAFLYHEHDRERRPAAIHLPDIAGVRDSHRRMARRLAEQGYVVLLPNVFYRTARTPVFDFQPKFPDERTMKRIGELAAPMTPEAMERDAASYINYLAVQGFVSETRMGVVGYCFTGGMAALRFPAARPDRVGAGASFHGGSLYSDSPASPHLVLPRIPTSDGPRLYFGHAANDQFMPQGAIDKLDGALAAWGGTYESEIYEGALHGWTVPDSPAYSEPEAERAFAKLTVLFAATLK